MSNKDRVGHEKVFLVWITNIDGIPKKYSFDYNHGWMYNNSETKRITKWKSKADPMSLTAEIGFGRYSRFLLLLRELS
jgi:hypothetical protein